MLGHEELGGRNVVICDDAALELARQDRAGAVAPIAQVLRRSRIAVFGDVESRATRYLKESPGLRTLDELVRRAVQVHLDREVSRNRHGVSAAGIVEDMFGHHELRGWNVVVGNRATSYLASEHCPLTVAGVAHGIGGTGIGVLGDVEGGPARNL